MDLQKVNSFFEKFWLVVGIGTLCYGLHYVSTQGMEGNGKYLLYPFAAFFLYGLRRMMRKRMEKNAAKS
jgi:hypothetical protein